ncbi:uncharacterized protein [Coffea arabica]|uniref:Late embryogenesis abundant protein LEA-2 subgroup domain-containing protein n=1 Tax=Coffea arabica TaxID=13443 RepID=A0A6P6SBG1_COFAR
MLNFSLREGSSLGACFAMAGLAANNSRGGQAQPSGNQRPQRNLSRRVSFNESTLKQSESPRSSVIDVEGQRNNTPPRNSGCNICCAWASLIVGILVVMFLIVGAIFFSFFQSNMPEFHFQRLQINRLDISTTKSSDTTFLTTDIQVDLNATNKNGIMPVFYTSLTADLSSQDIDLGKVHLPDMEQKPQNSARLKLHSQLQKEPVTEADAKDLIQKSQNHQILMNVIVGGVVHYVINGHKMPGFPFKVLCEDIYQGLLDSGEVPKCQVKMTPVS